MDLPPGLLAAGNPTWRRNRLRHRKVGHSKTVSDILGESHEDDDLIPSDADEVQPADSATLPGSGNGVRDKDARTSTRPTPVHAFVSVQVAFVAPDATPDFAKPVDRSKVPAPVKVNTPQADPNTARGTLDTVLGNKSPEQNKSVVARAEEFSRNMQAEAVSGVKSGLPVEDLMGEGKPMPEHVPATPQRVCEAFRSFGGIKAATKNL